MCCGVIARFSFGILYRLGEIGPTFRKLRLFLHAGLGDWASNFISLSRAGKEITTVDQLRRVGTEISDYAPTVQVQAGIPKDSLQIDWERVAVVSANFGDRSPLAASTIQIPCDHLLISDREQALHENWRIRPPIFPLGDARFSARWVKTHLKKFVNEQVRWVIWIDSNIVAKESMEPALRAFINSRLSLGLFSHPHHQNLSSEFRAIMRLGKENYLTLLIQWLRFRPFLEDKVWETGVMFVDLESPNIDSFFNSWWEEILQGSARDQISLPKVLSELDLLPFDLSLALGPLRRSEVLELVPSWRRQTPASVESKPRSPLVESIAGVPNGFRCEIDVVIPVRGAVDLVEIAVESFITASSGLLNQIFLVDDGSKSHEAERLQTLARKYPQILVLRNPKSQGYSYAVTRGVLASSANFVLIANSDLRVFPGWDSGMIAPLLDDGDIGAVGPVSNAAGHQSIPRAVPNVTERVLFQSPVNRLNEVQIARIVKTASQQSSYIFTPFLHGFCYLLRRSTFLRLGGLDLEAFPRGYGEEIDLFFRMNRAGLKSVVTPQVFVYHHKSQSFSLPSRLRLLFRSRSKLRTKYGFLRLVNSNLILTGLNGQFQKTGLVPE